MLKFLIHNNVKLVLCLTVLWGISNCNMIPNHASFQELHQHKGSKNYEVSTIFPKEFEIWQVLLDTVSKNLNVAGKTNPINKKETVGGRKKVSIMGEVLGEGPGYNILKDGTLVFINTYFNWVFDGDQSEHPFKNPLSEEEQKDPEKWLKKFKTLYEKASYVYESSWEYHFKIDTIWYKMKYNLEVVNEDFVKKNPAGAREDVRLMELRDLRSGAMEKDTTLVALKGYEKTDSEEGSGLNPISFSAGYYYLELYMPLGDTIKIKRHGSMGMNMQFYKIPVTQGGRNDVVFIVQEPNEMYPNREFGGMYVVRPRNLDQEQYGPHESNADSFTNQYNSNQGKIDVESKFLKPMKD